MSQMACTVSNPNNAQSSSSIATCCPEGLLTLSPLIRESRGYLQKLFINVILSLVSNEITFIQIQNPTQKE